LFFFMRKVGFDLFDLILFIIQPGGVVSGRGPHGEE